MRTALLLTAALLTSAAAAAGDVPVELSADLRAEYLAGEPILVRLTASNPSAEAQSMADLDSRTWLVKFTMTDAGGGARSWHSTPPGEDPGGRWRIAPRGQRQVLLEVPSSAGLPPGDYTLEVAVDDDGQLRELAPQPLRLAPPDPVGGRAWYDPLAVESVGFQTAWVHRAASGYDLYLHHASGDRPDALIGDYHLLHLDEAIEPILSLSRPQESWDRFIYWQSGERGIRYARLQGHALRGAPRLMEAPYPELELIGRGSTDPGGGLHVPVWIPDPSGSGGELRVVSIRERGSRFRSAGHYRERPELVETAVDGAGELRLLVLSDDLVLYHLSSAGDLPAAGELLLGGDEARWIVAARFGYLPSLEDRPGGLGILLLSEGLREEADGGTSPVLQGRWTSLSGRTLHTFPVVDYPPGFSPQDLLPRGYDPFVLLLKKDGVKQLLQLAPERAPRSLTWVPDARLGRDREGGIWLRGLGSGGPVVQFRVSL